MRLSSVTLGLGVVLAACTSRPPSPAAGDDKGAATTASTASSAEAPTFAELISRSMPSVVLLLNTHVDDTVTYGAGFLVGPGLVLTSEHVVASGKKLGAMLYKSGRTSYTPMDGGLARFLFENQSDIVGIREV